MNFEILLKISAISEYHVVYERPLCSATTAAYRAKVGFVRPSNRDRGVTHELAVCQFSKFIQNSRLVLNTVNRSKRIASYSTRLRFILMIHTIP